MQFHGETFEPVLDQERLSRQWERIYHVMCDHSWRTLSELCKETGDPEASASARLRDLRKMGYTVERRRRPGFDERRGIFEYRLLMVPEVKFEGGQGVFL